MGNTSRIELPVATRHRRDMTGKLMKAALNQNAHTLAKFDVDAMINVLSFQCPFQFPNLIPTLLVKLVRSFYTQILAI